MIPLAKPNINTQRVLLDLMTVLTSGWWTMGEYTKNLEKEFAEYVGAKYAIATNSCSMSLFLSLIVLDVRDHYVYTSPLTFCSTINSAIHAGARGVFLADINFDTQCMNPSNIFPKPGPDDVLLPVHFAGFPCNMNEFVELSKETGARIVEDCAHAVETQFHRQHVGTFGDMGCYSFNPTKNIAAPEMGMIVTNDEEKAEKLRRLRIHGMDAEASERVNSNGTYSLVDCGYKANCTDFEAVVALSQLRNVEANWEARKYIWNQYNLAFKNFCNREIFNGIYPGIRPSLNPNVGYVHGYHLYTICLGNRDDFIAKMREKQVYCGIHYKPVNLHPCYRNLGWHSGMFNNAEWIGKRTVSLPLGPGMTTKDVNHVVSATKELLETGDYLL